MNKHITSRVVYVASPYKGDVEANVMRAMRYCRFVIHNGCLPIAPHVYLTKILDDNIADERRLGIELGLQLLVLCDELWVFGNKISEGMTLELKLAQILNIPIRMFNDRCESPEVG